ncbi:MAG: DUF1850 domain-containing protein [Methylobacteriaceae bacterium]|nr:DUF1850 domain-containing protein [Methylobacteriaceae bacterium]
MSLCLTAGATATRLAVAAFTLAWTHSVEKTRWEEDWRIEATTLVAVEARVKGSGAGMEPGPDARFDGTWWRWTPRLPPAREISLRRSDALPEGWTLCVDGGCRTIAGAGESADVVVLSACP